MKGENMEALFLTKAERNIIGEALNTLQVEKMKRLNQTKTDSFLFDDPEKAREKIYNDMDQIEDLFDRLNWFN